MDEGFGDQESSIVARVAEIFTEVQVDAIYGLIRRVTKFHALQDSVDSAVEKISNYLLENNNNNSLVFDDVIEAPCIARNSSVLPISEINDRDLIKARFIGSNAPALRMNEIINLDDSGENEEPNLMTLARQLAGNVQRVAEPKVMVHNAENNLFQWMNNDIVHDEKLGIEPPFVLIDETLAKGDDPQPKFEKVTVNNAENKIFQWMNNEIVHYENLTINEPPDVLMDQTDAKGDGPQCKKASATKLKVPKDKPAKRRKKDKPLKVIEKNSVATNGEATNDEPQKQELKVTEPPKQFEPAELPQPEDQTNDVEIKAAEKSESKQSSKNDLNIVSSVPDLDCTLTDIDVMFECMCCYNEVPFDYMVQCSEGHLFCCQCLERYAQESVYGHGKGDLKCMTTECVASFPRSQLQRALPANLYKKYEERISDECLNSAGLENFTRCKFCNYGAELDPAQTFFKCPQCTKHFCRTCEEEYKNHEGLTCEQVEKDDETKIRTNYEEKMAEAKIRTCLKCKSRFTKESGCNKITCRCGQTMCYICRTSMINYNHFCQHPRTPTKDCSKCKACFLWSNADEDDRLAIEEIRKEGLKAREKEGFTGEKAIGAPKDPEVVGRAAAHNHLDEVINNVALQAHLEVQRAARLQAALLNRQRRAPGRPRRGRRQPAEAAAARPIPLGMEPAQPHLLGPQHPPLQPIVPQARAPDALVANPNPMERQDGLVANLERNYQRRRDAADRHLGMLENVDIRAVLERNAVALQHNVALRERLEMDQHNRAYRHRYMLQQNYQRILERAGYRDPRMQPPANDRPRVEHYNPNQPQAIDLAVPPFAANAQNDGLNQDVNGTQNNPAEEVNAILENAANAVAVVRENGDTFTVTKEAKGRLLHMIEGMQTALNNEHYQLAKELIKFIKTSVEEMK